MSSSSGLFKNSLTGKMQIRYSEIYFITENYFILGPSKKYQIIVRQIIKAFYQNVIMVWEVCICLNEYPKFPGVLENDLNVGRKSSSPSRIRQEN